MFDGSSIKGKGRARIVLKPPKREEVAFSYKLDFPCTNNEVEYEAFIIKILVFKELGIRIIRIKGEYSNLIVK